MGQEERALSARRALARASGGERPADPAAEAEARLRATLDEIGRLDAEIEAFSADLADFSRRWERSLADAFHDLAAAERLVRRLQALEDGIAALAERLRAGAAPSPRPRADRRTRARRASGARTAARDAWAGADEAGGEADANPAAQAPGSEPGDPEAPPEVEPAEIALKRLYRRLARVLHPDFAQDDAERARLGDLMARVNAAYAKGDLAALEIMAERVGAGEPPGELTPEERRAHLERRIATLARIAASLARERARLDRSDTARLRAEALRREAEGRDFVEETRAEVREEADAAYADALHRLARLGKAARDLSRARSTAMDRIVKRGPTGARRAFDPLEEADIVRAGAARLERQRATPAARELARLLEARVQEAPWEVALALLAFFAEDAGGRPPDTLATADGWAARWDRLREAWPDAPDLARACARLPRHLAVGARAQGDAVVAGVQLADAALLAGVRIALERAAVADVAREVLAALGPEEACAACGSSAPALHLLRTRGLDELNGLACPTCGAILRSYWRYGEADGLEALAPHALRLGLVAEATAQLAGTAIGFQMLPEDREKLTADRLRRRFAELYLAPYEVDLPVEAVGVARGKEPLAPGARLGGEGRLRFTIREGAGTTAEELLELPPGAHRAEVQAIGPRAARAPALRPLPGERREGESRRSSSGSRRGSGRERVQDRDRDGPILLARQVGAEDLAVGRENRELLPEIGDHPKADGGDRLAPLRERADHRRVGARVGWPREQAGDDLRAYLAILLAREHRDEVAGRVAVLGGAREARGHLPNPRAVGREVRRESVGRQGHARVLEREEEESLALGVPGAAELRGHVARDPLPRLVGRLRDERAERRAARWPRAPPPRRSPPRASRAPSARASRRWASRPRSSRRARGCGLPRACPPLSATSASASCASGVPASSSACRSRADASSGVRGPAWAGSAPRIRGRRAGTPRARGRARRRGDGPRARARRASRA